MKRFCILLPMILLLLVPHGQAGDKAAPWKPFLPPDAYKDLTERSIKIIEEAAKSGEKGAADRIAVEAVILAGATLSVTNVKEKKDSLMQLHGAAQQAAQAARKNDLKNLAEFGKSIDMAPKPSPALKDWLPNLLTLDELMTIFRNKAKKGEGIPPDLQYQPKLKNLNGIEALIGALGSKKLSEENLAKVSQELPKLAYRIAVVGALTDTYTPTKDAKKWREYSAQMRDASVALAEAAHKKNGAGILQAAQALENSCTLCHRDFKNK